MGRGGWSGVDAFASAITIDSPDKCRSRAKDDSMNLSVVGTGYVGLVTGTGFASLGHQVTCVEIDAHKMRSLEQGHVPWYEPGLQEMMLGQIDQGGLRFTSDLSDSISDSDIVLITVGTPSRPDGSADTSAVFRAAEQIGDLVKRPTTVVIRSTVPVGTTRAVRSVIFERSGVDCPTLSNPEFLREGHAVKDFRNPSRVVIGADVPGHEDLLKDLYASFVPSGLVIVTSTRSSEMSKYASNGFLATKISFINEIAMLCEELGADVEEVRRIMGLDPRIGPAFLGAGIGFGGSCLPKDTRALAYMGNEVGLPMPLVESAIRVNSVLPTRLVQNVHRYLGSLKAKRIAVWGLSLKPETDDVREAPALAIVDLFLEEGASVCVYDPSEAIEQARSMFGERVECATDQYECASGSDVIVIATEWKQFSVTDWNRIADSMAHPVVFDGRNALDPEDLRAARVEYRAVGRSPVKVEMPTAPLPAEDDFGRETALVQFGD